MSQLAAPCSERGAGTGGDAPRPVAEWAWGPKSWHPDMDTSVSTFAQTTVTFTLTLGPPLNRLARPAQREAGRSRGWEDHQ